MAVTTTAKSKRRPGRPPRSSTPSLERIEIRVTKAERQAWLVAANKSKQTLSDWIRERCNG